MPTSIDPGRLERELAYYRRECNDLGARLLRLQEEQSQAFREARRSRTVAKLIREAHRVADTSTSPDEIGAALLQVIVENTLCDRAAFVRSDGNADTPDRFLVTHAIGLGTEIPAESLTVPSAPAFFLTTSRTALEPPAYELTGILRVPYILWSHDRASGHGLIIGNQSEANVSRPFEVGDQELVEGALSVYIDVLARKKAELSLRAAMAAAEEASALRARFLATWSHELRTPLSAIIGFSEMMATGSRYSLTQDQRSDYANQILQSGRSLLVLINDILDYSSLSRSAPMLAVEWTSAEYIIAGAAREIAALAIPRQITVDVTPTEAGLEILVDPMRFRQIVNNLLSNAVKFTAPGGRAHIGAQRLADGRVEITITDTGVGMLPGDVPRAMEPFQQIDNGRDRAFAGTGLGLPIAKGLTEAHGGTLDLASEAGRGTTVTLTLPASAVRIAPPEA